MAKNRPPSRNQTLLNTIQGRWRVVYSELGGEMTPVVDFSTIVMEIKGDTFSVEKNGAVVDEGKFRINTTTNPHEIVLIYSKGDPIFLGAPRAGVFQVEGDTFKTCLASIGLRAPADLNTTPDSEAVLSIHQRVGAEGGTGFSRSASLQNSQW